MFEPLKQQHTIQLNTHPFEYEKDVFGIELTPGVHELVDINSIKKQKTLNLVLNSKYRQMHCQGYQF